MVQFIQPVTANTQNNILISISKNIFNGPTQTRPPRHYKFL